MNWPPYRWRSLSPAQRCEIRRLRGRGVTVTAIATRYSVSPRTVYRACLHGDPPAVRVAVEAWQATFEVTPDGPVQVSPWEHGEADMLGVTRKV